MERHVVTGDNEVVVSVSAAGSPEERAANARLIAAAPDLLAVCEEVAASGYGVGTLERLHAAIAKARIA
jgi:hypothetical protein